MLRRALSLATTILALHLASGGAVAAPLGERPNPVDDELVRMGKAIPGFGGMFYDAEGYPTVYLRDPGAKAALGALKSLGSGVRVLPGEYEFGQLVTWKRALHPLLGRPGVVYLDADEASNRVVVGIDAAFQAKSRIREDLSKELESHGVPAAAVVYRETGSFREAVGVMRMEDLEKNLEKKPAAATANLQGNVRPVPGGVQVTFIKQPYIYFCTDTVNAYLDGAFGFVTNSHCTSDRGKVDGTRYTQGDPYGADIATEIADPDYQTGGDCPAGRKCRFSDSAFARYDGAATIAGFRKLARTTGRGTEEGSLVLKPAATRFNVAGAGAAPFTGQVVNKIGRTTGWTYGPVVATCVDVNSSATEFTIWCQHLVQAGTDGGDSGSPVFSWTKGNNVTLLGVLWAGGSDGQGHTLFAFSPFASIQDELGALRIK